MPVAGAQKDFLEERLEDRDGVQTMDYNNGVLCTRLKIQQNQSKDCGVY